MAKKTVDKKGVEKQPVEKQTTDKQTVQKQGGDKGMLKQERTNLRFKDQSRLDYLKSQTKIEYKDYPYHISHNDPTSKDYVACEQTDIQTKLKHEAYNEMIKGLKLGIQMQEYVYESLERLDRPYKRGEGVKGDTLNVYSELKDYGKPKDGHVASYETVDDQVLHNEMRNENRWVDQTIFESKDADDFSHYQEYLKELDSRPVNSHFNSHKGYKYDVEVPYEERVPYMADRLGHPELIGTPMERLLRLECDVYHPEYIDQPFVQPPDLTYDQTLDFEEGEVIYENTNIQEWCKFWKGSTLMSYLTLMWFIPLNIGFFTHQPLEMATSKSLLYHHDVSYYYFDRLGIHIPMIAGFAYYSAYIIGKLQDDFLNEYVVKMQYSKDKELLFVTRVSYFGGLEEEVHEMHHIEMLPPSLRTAVASMSLQDEDGLLEIENMNGKNKMVVYKEDKYWNPDLKSDFMKSISKLWGNDYISQTRQQKIEERRKREEWAVGFNNLNEENVQKNIRARLE